MTTEPEPGKKDYTVGLVGQPYHILLKKMSKGYQWEISIHGTSETQVLNAVKSIDDKLRLEYGKEVDE